MNIIEKLKDVSIKRISLALLFCVMLFAAISGWYKPANEIVTTVYLKPKEEKVVTKIKRVDVPGPQTVITIEKEVIVEKLKLPDWFAKDKNEQPIANADLMPTRAGYSVVGTINTQTGEGGIIAKEKEQPFIGLPNEKEIGIRYGLSTQGATGSEANVYGKWNFLRVGNVHVGTYGEINSDPDAKVMIDASYKF
jgi:hypothetical protein